MWLAVVCVLNVYCLSVFAKIPAGYILKVTPHCGEHPDRPAVVTIVTDLSVGAKAECAERTVPFKTSDGVNFKLLVGYPGHSNLPCVFKKQQQVSTFVVKVLASYGDVGRLMPQQEEVTITCTFDANAAGDTQAHNISQRLLTPKEIQSHMGQGSNATFTLRLTDIRGKDLASSAVHLGRTVQLRAYAVGLPQDSNVMPVSCDAVSTVSGARYSILRAGCGDGVVISKTDGFSSFSSESRSPYFQTFRLEDDSQLRYECNFTLSKRPSGSDCQIAQCSCWGANTNCCYTCEDVHVAYDDQYWEMDEELIAQCSGSPCTVNSCHNERARRNTAKNKDWSSRSDDIASIPLQPAPLFTVQTT
ncbi:vitelline envelope sperm lysin receptor-like isoform X2 [Haliotis rufescens]|uniref:vitelline envelope sperm lysin receptor-like isoform X2 n=1 Tax=Haliotis rufescens TaxID=6454 RepID=UPI00201F1C09|nr:vitelline envelope sperm lysin receptor-like isoform X2 [Haliotis rufescens]